MMTRLELYGGKDGWLDWRIEDGPADATTGAWRS